jgi:hypothetical protein
MGMGTKIAHERGYAISISTSILSISTYGPRPNVKPLPRVECDSMNILWDLCRKLSIENPIVAYGLMNTIELIQFLIYLSKTSL